MFILLLEGWYIKMSYKELCKEILEFAEHGDYSNGVEFYGIDEVRVRAGEYLDILREKLDKETETDWYEDILEFHKVFKHHIEKKPTLPLTEVWKLRYNLIKEEMEETLESIERADLVELADGIGDSIVVLLGTAVSYGIDMRPIWKLIHSSNMAKLGGGKRADGKSLKPEGWNPPDIKSEIRRQQK